MPLSHIEHFLVAADDIDATRDWYARVLGMKPGPHPDFGFPVHWMYLGETDIVHIGPSAKAAGEIQKKYLGRTSRDAGTGTGALDHRSEERRVGKECSARGSACGGKER